MARNKSQHWVPQSYLEAWVDPHTPENYDEYVHIFNRDGTNHKTRSPKNILAMKDLYTIFEGTDRNLRIENTFSRWEKDFVRVRSILEKLEFGNGDDASDLFVFVGAMISRPPHRIDFYKSQWQSILAKARSIKIDPNSRPIKPLTSGPGLSLDEAQQLVDNPMGTWFPNDVAATVEALSTLFGCDIFVNESEHPFLTSDSPAVVQHPPRADKFRMMPRGLGSPGCEITFPVSPRLALLFRHKKPSIHSFIGADWETVFEINFRTITRARNIFISDQQDIFFVKSITERVAEVDRSRAR